MPTRNGAGELISLIAFDKRGLVDDGYGNLVTGDFVEQFRQHADLIPLKGSEDVVSARLESRQPVVIRIRASGQARALTADWQARDVRMGTLFAIHTVTRDDQRSMIDILCETGGPTG
jgi:head-tail adaptor